MKNIQYGGQGEQEQVHISEICKWDGEELIWILRFTYDEANRLSKIAKNYPTSGGEEVPRITYTLDYREGGSRLFLCRESGQGVGASYEYLLDEGGKLIEIRHKEGAVADAILIESLADCQVYACRYTQSGLRSCRFDEWSTTLSTNWSYGALLSMVYKDTVQSFEETYFDYTDLPNRFYPDLNFLLTCPERTYWLSCWGLRSPYLLHRRKVYSDGNSTRSTFVYTETDSRVLPTKVLEQVEVEDLQPRHYAYTITYC